MLLRCMRAAHPVSLSARTASTRVTALRRALPFETKAAQTEEKPAGPIWWLPAWAEEEKRPPLSLRLSGAALLLPLGLGAVAVHLLAEEEETRDPSDQGSGSSRLVLNWSLHYAGALLAFCGASHWGLQLAEFGVPRRSDYMGLYYLSRFSLPVVFVLFGWLGSVLSAAEPREASLWLLTGYGALTCCDLYARGIRVVPLWWFWWRGGFSLSAMFLVCVLLLSERNLYLGQKPMMRM